MGFGYFDETLPVDVHVIVVFFRDGVDQTSCALDEHWSVEHFMPDHEYILQRFVLQ